MERIFEVLRTTTGLNLNETHKMSVINYVQKRQESLGMNLEQYVEFFPKTEAELSLLVDEAAINETYFFREEQQFEFLSTHVLPKLGEGKKLSIWSAACSSGEEPLSLLALCDHLGLKAEIFASDIDSQALATFRKGFYYKNSFRPDGTKFHPLLNKLGRFTSNGFELSKECLGSINFSNYNLVSSNVIPFADNSLDLIFIRNVFIYFDKETRNRIIEKMERVLKPNGLLMLSVNEIAGVEADEKSLLFKDHDGRVYFFRKAASAEEKKELSRRTLISVTDAASGSGPVVNSYNSADYTSRNFTTGSSISAPITSATTPDIAHAERYTLSVERASSFTSSNSTTKTKPVSQTDNKILITNENLNSQMQELLNLIFSKKTDSAKDKLDTLIFRPEKQEFLFFAKALICEKEGNLDEAKNLYGKACILNSTMWPSTYNLACIYKNTSDSKQALKHFLQCMSQIENYISQKQNTFDFLMESFSPEYFLELCRQNIRKLQEK